MRRGAVLTAAAGALALTGCAPGTTQAAAPAYADGTYTAQGAYATPETVETITVTVTLEDDVITSVEVEGTPQRPQSREHQAQFIGGIAAQVVGRDIDSIHVTRVAGSSLTSGGFSQAIEVIKREAAE